VGLEINSFLFASPLRPTPGIVQNYIGTVACIYLAINNTCNPVLACSRTKCSGGYIKIKKFLRSDSIIKAVAPLLLHRNNRGNLINMTISVSSLFLLNRAHLTKINPFVDSPPPPPSKTPLQPPKNCFSLPRTPKKQNEKNGSPDPTNYLTREDSNSCNFRHADAVPVARNQDDSPVARLSQLGLKT
jgi:hypothetical protein